MISSEKQEISLEYQRSKGTRHTSKSKIGAVKAGKGKIILGLGSPYLILILVVYLFTPLHGQVSFLYKLALSRGPHLLQALQFGIVGSSGGSSVANQLLHLGLKFG